MKEIKRELTKFFIMFISLYHIVLNYLKKVLKIKSIWVRAPLIVHMKS